MEKNSLIDNESRRKFVKTAVYVTPAILTLNVNPSFASAGSGYTNGDQSDWWEHANYGQSKKKAKKKVAKKKAAKKKVAKKKAAKKKVAKKKAAKKKVAKKKVAIRKVAKKIAQA